MTRKEYNAVINECKSTTCYHCGAKTLCNNLQEVGYIVGDNLIFWDSLTESQKEKVQSAKGNPTKPASSGKPKQKQPKQAKKENTTMAKSKWGKFNDSVDLQGLQNDVKNADTSGGGNFPEVPKGTYEVGLASLEVKPTKNGGKPMVALSFKILNGDYKGQRLFENKVIYGTKDDARMIKSVIGFLSDLDSGVDIDFHDFDQFEETVLDVAEAVQGNLEYVIEYDPEEFFRISIKEVFEVDAA